MAAPSGSPAIVMRAPRVCISQRRDETASNRAASPGTCPWQDACRKYPVARGGRCYNRAMTDSASEGAAPRGRSIDEFDASYAGTPPWDIGRAQPAFVGVAESGSLHGRLLDVGCGTGEHVLMAARLGLTATGVDAAPTAIGIARRKAAERG